MNSIKRECESEVCVVLQLRHESEWRKQAELHAQACEEKVGCVKGGASGDQLWWQCVLLEEKWMTLCGEQRVSSDISVNTR